MSKFLQDEINLYELWFIITKHKYLFGLVFVIIFISGIIFTLLMPKSYEYTQGIKVAGYYDGGTFIPLQSAKTSIAKLTAFYLPSELAKYNSQHPENPIPLQSNNMVVNNIGDGIIVLETKGKLKDHAIYAGLFKGLLADVVKDNDYNFQTMKTLLGNELTTLRKRLTAQEQRNKMLLDRISSQSIITWQFLFDQQQDSITSLIARIAQVKEHLESLKNSYFDSPLILSNVDGGISKSALLILSFIMAIILGLVAVFIREFFANVHLLSEEEQTKRSE